MVTDDVPHSVLDNGAVVHMKPGDTMVQRGTVHGWTNPGSAWARVYFLLTGKYLICNAMLCYNNLKLTSTS